MKRSEAEPLIIRQWEIWVFENVPDGKPATGRHGLQFFSYLQEKHSALLSFKSHGDKWQTVHSILVNHGRVAD